MERNIDNERLWNDVKDFVERKIRENATEMYTNSQRKRFWVKGVTGSYIRVEREDSKLPFEDIPTGDFIDIFRDLQNPKYISAGYMQKDLHGGQNRHTAVSFTLISKQPYIKSRKVGRGLRYYLILDNLKQ